MKRRFLKMISVLTASLCLISAECFTASANANQEPDVPIAAETIRLETFLAANGFTAEQIQRVRLSSITASYYISYFNLTDDSSLLDDFYMNIGYVDTNVTWASTVNYDGFVVNDDIVGNYHSDVTPTGATYQHVERVIFSVVPNNPPDFMNLIRYKFHGSGTISEYATNLYDGNDTSFSNINDYIISGKVEAGNVTKYITNSTDTASQITSDDASRILQHYALIRSYQSDPDWTDEATIAADVNFDGVVNASDALLISNVLAGQADFW